MFSSQASHHESIKTVITALLLLIKQMYAFSVLKDRVNNRSPNFSDKGRIKLDNTQEGGIITTLDPCLVHARVSGGLPVQAQVNAASMPVSTVCGLGSDKSLGPTTENTRRRVAFKKTHTHNIAQLYVPNDSIS